MTRALVTKGRGVSLNIPLQVTGVADDLAAKPDGLAFSIEAANGVVWEGTGMHSTGQLVSLRTELSEALYERIKDQPVRIRGSLYLTLYGDRRETKVPVNGEVRGVPGMGLCRATGGPPATYFLGCVSALRPRADRVAVLFEPHPRVVADYDTRFMPSYSPFPAELSINPVTPSNAYSTYQGALEAVTVSSEQPVAFVRAPLEIEGLRLGAFEAAAK
jgi:hypothetical protein